MKKCAVFNDLSGFGKCSLAADIPILSVCGIEAHPFPTAVLSNQTAYASYALADVSRCTDAFLSEWQKLGASFDGILTGYFVNAAQVNSVINFIKNQNALTVVDPVMGDGGEKYTGFDDALCEGIKALCLCADVITPNETELYILTGKRDINKAAQGLIAAGIPEVVVTGLEAQNKIGCSVFTKDKTAEFFEEKTGGYFSGTGDIFASVLTAKMLGGADVFSAAQRAVSFVSYACKITEPGNSENGVDFEKALSTL